jgi:hypothetical protein
VKAFGERGYFDDGDNACAVTLALNKYELRKSSGEESRRFTYPEPSKNTAATLHFCFLGKCSFATSGMGLAKIAKSVARLREAVEKYTGF